MDSHTLTNIWNLDYVVLLCEDMERMRDFYHDMPDFPIYRDLDGWLEMRVDGCHAELLRKGVEILEAPCIWEHGHRTLFFKDPKGNILEIYAEL